MVDHIFVDRDGGIVFPTIYITVPKDPKPPEPIFAERGAGESSGPLDPGGSIPAGDGSNASNRSNEIMGTSHHWINELFSLMKYLAGADTFDGDSSVGDGAGGTSYSGAGSGSTGNAQEDTGTLGIPPWNSGIGSSPTNGSSIDSSGEPEPSKRINLQNDIGKRDKHLIAKRIGARALQAERAEQAAKKAGLSIKKGVGLELQPVITNTFGTVKDVLKKHVPNMRPTVTSGNSDHPSHRTGRGSHHRVGKAIDVGFNGWRTGIKEHAKRRMKMAIVAHELSNRLNKGGFRKYRVLAEIWPDAGNDHIHISEVGNKGKKGAFVLDRRVVRNPKIFKKIDQFLKEEKEENQSKQSIEDDYTTQVYTDVHIAMIPYRIKSSQEVERIINRPNTGQKVEFEIKQWISGKGTRSPYRVYISPGDLLSSPKDFEVSLRENIDAAISVLKLGIAVHEVLENENDKLTLGKLAQKRAAAMKVELDRFQTSGSEIDS